MKRIFTISGLVLLCLLLINTAFGQGSTVKGIVTDAATGENLIGVSVTVKGTTNGTQTDVSGAFTLTALSNATLTFSYLGYTSQDVAINNQSTLTVKLLASAKQLDQVVVIGYGAQRKVDNTGSIASVKGA